ncbi:ThiF family adenylyltransferase, partial [Pseudoalteromonas distincta]|uniref:ThiF family adenylyltransferase n=1 Tax=Pseudoalteromonas distincta TaxID=77608 RepID=UPI0034E8E2BA
MVSSEKKSVPIAQTLPADSRHDSPLTTHHSLSLDQQRRYARQTMLADIGQAGQKKLLAARVLVIGAGGLGSASISY